MTRPSPSDRQGDQALPPPPEEPPRTSRGEELFRANLETIDRAISYACRKGHLSADAAQDFGSHVRLKLMSDDYAILNKFKGRSSLLTFLSVTVGRLLLDYRIAAWGRWRPSAEASRVGPIGEELERLIARDGYRLDEAYEILTTNHGVVTTREEIEAIAARLPVRCRPRAEPVEDLENLPSTDTADGPIEEVERRLELSRLADALHEERALLPSREQLLLSLRYDDGRRMPEVAAIMKEDAKALYRDEERIRKKLRERLVLRGFDPQGLFD